MSESQAQALAGKLAAAFPRDWIGEATNAAYVERLSRLPRFEAALDAINVLIDSELRLPPIAAVIDEYRRHHSLYDPPALLEPEITEEQRMENVERIKELVARISPKGL